MEHDRTVRPLVRKTARLMDTAYRVPGTKIRFGLDPIIGLVPVLGDTATALIGLGMLGEARRLGLGAGVQGRMIWNLVLDWLVGLVPGLDLILDTAVKAHTRNAALLERHATARPSPEPWHPSGHESKVPSCLNGAVSAFWKYSKILKVPSS